MRATTANRQQLVPRWLRRKSGMPTGAFAAANSRWVCSGWGVWEPGRDWQRNRAATAWPAVCLPISACPCDCCHELHGRHQPQRPARGRHVALEIQLLHRLRRLLREIPKDFENSFHPLQQAGRPPVQPSLSTTVRGAASAVRSDSCLDARPGGGDQSNESRTVFGLAMVQSPANE